MSSYLGIKRWYLTFLEKEKKNWLENILFFFLLILSYLFGMIVSLRNFLYDKRILKVYHINRKVISIGNICWGGSGKTSLAIYLFRKLASKFKVAVITKGYAEDEYRLLKDNLKKVFDDKNRIKLIRRLVNDFDIFILDDAFQYRKLARDLDIVVIRKDELLRSKYLLPASSFREPLTSLKRADIVIITYSEAKRQDYYREKVLEANSKLKVFFADYIFKGFLDRDKKLVSLEYFKGRKLGVLTAIGYPQGFLGKLKSIDLWIGKVEIFPDHYCFSPEEITLLEESFIKEGIKDIIITYKDYYHLDFTRANLNYFIFCVELKILEEDKFLRYIEDVLTDKVSLQVG